MKKIAVLFTGGTIGSRQEKGSINVTPGGGWRLLEHYLEQRNRREVTFAPRQLMETLSENLQPHAWETMAQGVKQAWEEGCDGILLTHGTDTLPYTSAALSFLLGASLPVPVFLISADFPLEDGRTNGFANFSAAVDCICQIPLRGVFVPYCQGAQCFLHLGTRLEESRPFADDFSSAGGLWWAKAENGGFLLKPTRPGLTPQAVGEKPFVPPPGGVFSDRILYIKPYPGLRYELLLSAAEKNPPAAVLHGTYHSGTACTGESVPFSAVAFIKSCTKSGIPVYLAPVPKGEKEQYASTCSLLEAGALSLGYLPAPAALTKLMLAYGSPLSEKERLEYLQTDAFFEHMDV